MFKEGYRPGTGYKPGQGYRPCLGRVQRVQPCTGGGGGVYRLVQGCRPVQGGVHGYKPGQGYRPVLGWGGGGGGYRLVQGL